MRHVGICRRASMERQRHSNGSAISTELLARAESRLWGSWSMSPGLALGLRSLWTVWVRCMWRLRSSPRLRSSLSALRASVVKS